MTPPTLPAEPNPQPCEFLPIYGIQHHMAKAQLLYHDKGYYADGAVVEMKIWRLLSTSKERPHGLKYSLFYGEAGRRTVGYDNERGKGDHRHLGSEEFSYAFETVEKLIADFLSDVRMARGER